MSIKTTAALLGCAAAALLSVGAAHADDETTVGSTGLITVDGTQVGRVTIDSTGNAVVHGSTGSSPYDAPDGAPDGRYLDFLTGPNDIFRIEGVDGDPNTLGVAGYTGAPEGGPMGYPLMFADAHHTDTSGLLFDASTVTFDNVSSNPELSFSALMPESGSITDYSVAFIPGFSMLHVDLNGVGTDDADFNESFLVTPINRIVLSSNFPEGVDHGWQIDLSNLFGIDQIINM